jgi:type I restriction enzyme M protein
VPLPLIIEQYFQNDQDALDALKAEKEGVDSELTQMIEEHGSEDGILGQFEKLNKAVANKRYKEIAKDKGFAEEAEVLKGYLDLVEKQSELNGKIKDAQAALLKKALEQYPKLTTDEVKKLVVDAKWMAAMSKAIDGEMERISQRLTGRIKELIERYETPLPKIDQELEALESKVNAHLQKMGFVW